MNASHVAGAGFGAVVGALVVGVLQRFVNVHVSDVDSAAIGAVALSAGVGLGHAIGEFGLVGIGRVLLRGRPKSSAPTPLQ